MISFRDLVAILIVCALVWLAARWMTRAVQTAPSRQARRDARRSHPAGTGFFTRKELDFLAFAAGQLADAPPPDLIADLYLIPREDTDE